MTTEEAREAAKAAYIAHYGEHDSMLDRAKGFDVGYRQGDEAGYRAGVTEGIRQAREAVAKALDEGNRRPSCRTVDCVGRSFMGSGEPHLVGCYRRTRGRAMTEADALRAYLVSKGFNTDRMGNWDKSSGIGLAIDAFSAGFEAGVVEGIRRGRVDALNEAASAVDSLGHNWSGTVATALFSDADSLRTKAEEMR